MGHGVLVIAGPHARDLLVNITDADLPNAAFPWLMSQNIFMAHVGTRAMDSLRIKKSYRMWGQDLTSGCSSFEASMERSIRLNEPEFTGREALLRQQEQGVSHRFVTPACDVDDGDSIGNEPRYLDGDMIGCATASAYGHHVKQALALGLVPPEAAQVGTAPDIDILNKRYTARVIEESPYDPENTSLPA